MNTVHFRAALWGFGLLCGGDAAQLQLTTTRVASGLSGPLFLTYVPGEVGRVFILEQHVGTTGRVRVLDLATVVAATPFLSVPGVSTGGEQGLLGLAFHPKYQSNGLFYMDYTTTGAGPAGRTVVA